MHYRPLNEADSEPYLALESYAFRVNPDRSQLDVAKLARFRGLFVGEELAAQLELIPLELQAGPGTVAAAGIGSVASAPELRRRGHVAALLREAADELRAAGVPLCILHPFKRSFYRRYGWATFMERRVYRGAPELFRPFRRDEGGRFVAVGADGVDELDQIYRGALRWRFGLVMRDLAWWQREVLSDWERNRYYAYMWRDATGQGRAYLVFRFASENGEQRLQCREIAALDPTARAQLFAFLADQDSQVASVEFRAPADAPVNLLFPDPLEAWIDPHFMLRLLDVPAALEAYRFPRAARGRLTLAVDDSWIAANNGVFALELEGGHCHVERLPADSPAELRCEVGVLAQLYSRYLPPRTAAAFGVLEAPSRAALKLAEQAFAGLAPFNSDFF